MEPKTIFMHVALSVRDIEESIAWYNDIFGLKTFMNSSIPHNGALMAFVGNENFRIELFQWPDFKPLPEGRSHPDTDNATLGCKHFCVAVDNAAEFVKGLRARGVNVVFEPAGMPSYCAFILDPTGNIIEVFDKADHKE